MRDEPQVTGARKSPPLELGHLTCHSGFPFRPLECPLSLSSLPRRRLFDSDVTRGPCRHRPRRHLATGPGEDASGEEVACWLREASLNAGIDSSRGTGTAGIMLQ